MRAAGKIKVESIVPASLSRLSDISYNLWWSWNSELSELYSEIDSDLWGKSDGNPVRFLKLVNCGRLDEMSKNADFMSRYDQLVKKYDDYLTEKNTWFSDNHSDDNDMKIAYFSAEYGLSHVLPIYSGGLGILSGDHCKTASDLGLPFTAVGLFYKHGYFNQFINSCGVQETEYPDLDASMLPIKPVEGVDGNQMHIGVDFPGRKLYAKIWQVSIGRVSLYLMDTDTDMNTPDDRAITSRLYGGTMETRIQQEILLGIGGAKALDAVGIKPDVYHMNEGHSSFLALELLRRHVQDGGRKYSEALEAVRSSLVFTTHTSVPAGNDVFPSGDVSRYFNGFWDKLGINIDEFLRLGVRDNDIHNFNMTVLALNLSGYRNGVSELHGEVSRKIFNSLWSELPTCEVPVTHITNGVHVQTWLSGYMKKLYNKYFRNNWETALFDPEIWADANNIPDQELWSAHLKLKREMITFIQHRLMRRRQGCGSDPLEAEAARYLPDPNVLTIGFARRFATYKRADLIFRNIDRIRKIINAPNKPVQLVFAGKAHPADKPAQEIIRKITEISRQDGFAGKIFILENYDMSLAEKLVSGVDVWMNNPRRPLEACGTSGQKVCANGILNFSVLDGWWCEGYDGENGWVIGSDNTYANDHEQDNADSDTIYDVLENDIVPMYYDLNSSGIPEKWIHKVRKSISSLSHKYSTQRMLIDYTVKMYIPLHRRFHIMEDNEYSCSKQLSSWKSMIRSKWNSVSIKLPGNVPHFEEHTISHGSPVGLSVSVDPGELDTEDLLVEVYYGALGPNGNVINAKTMEMSVSDTLENGTAIYSIDLALPGSGEFSYTFRVFPYNKALINKMDMGMIKWL